MNEQLITTAKTVAAEFGLDPVLVCAVIEQESAWDTHALRLEQGFFRRYIKPLNHKSATEAACRSCSFGLMQVMGQVAREFGYKDDWDLLWDDPEEAIRLGCKVLRAKLAKAKGDVRQGLLYWNGGANKLYPEEVFARMDKYK